MSSTASRCTVDDFQAGLKKLGIACDASDSQVVINRYDADEDGRLGFWEFANILLPI